MKITDKHVSELTLSWLIGHFTAIQHGDTTLEKMTHQEVVDALLELKHRRAEDRMEDCKE